MSPGDQKLLQDAQQFVKNFISTKVDKSFIFHNIDHTLQVVKGCEIIAAKNELNERDYLCLMLAAWFHDTGYANGAYQHEENSQKIASSFLAGKGIEQEVINTVNSCILATKIPQSPSNLIEQIVCDADLFHLGSPDFADRTKLLRQELNKLQNEEVDKKEWRQLNIEFMQRHRYFTNYGREVLEPIKQQHLNKLLGKLGKKELQIATERVIEPNMLINPMDPPDPEAPKESDGEKDKDKKRKEKETRSERGIVAMFRIMSQTHINLSQMADSKANIMISVNTIVLSIMVSLLLGKLQFYPEYIIPTIILVLVCLFAVIYAILATRPNISGGSFTREDISNKQINLLFFGNFFKVELPDYEWAMKEMMNDKEYLFGSMIKDIYFLGIVLARKYKFLRISYNIFMFGLIVAIIAFGAAFVLSANNGGA